jgi:hypothetical protein
MIKHNYFVTLLMGGALALASVSCKDNNDDDIQPVPEVIKPGADDHVNPLFEENLSDLKQTFTLDGANGGTITGKDGTSISIMAGTLTKANGDAVTGDVTVEVIEIFKKSAMLLTKMPTQGRDNEGNIATLVSGGEIYVNVTQGDDQLKITGNYVIIAPTANTGGEDLDMKPFEGVKECDNTDCKIVWKEQDRDIKIGKAENGQGGVQSAYQIFQSQFGWTNIDRWYSDPRDKTTIFVDVPEGYDNTNCAVYLSYDGEPTALALFDRYDATTGLFTEHYGLIPIGLNVHFIMVSVIDGEWYYAIKAETITANHVETFTELQPITEAALTTLIDDLP